MATTHENSAPQTVDEWVEFLTKECDNSEEALKEINNFKYSDKNVSECPHCGLQGLKSVHDEYSPDYFHFAYNLGHLGIQSVVACSKGTKESYNTYEYFSRLWWEVSQVVFEALQKIKSSTETKVECTCATFVLANQGCQCGAFEKEMKK